MYCIDTSSLIDLKRRYPMDIFPCVWDKLHSLAQFGRLISPTLPLFPVQYVVIIEESAKGQKIPHVCNHYGIEWIRLLELFKRENWTF
ncbi:MAG: DUF4411 family protein [Candidatus Tectomicrobia bacterium]|nr:DUF4411 family protein [Candidatus Tectomicrobia bacterium]